MTNSIRTEIELLLNTKKENRIAIMEKGVTVSASDLYSIYPTRIGQISMTPGDMDTLMKSLIDRSISGDYTIPSGTTKIRNFAFENCRNLTSVTIPETVEVIGGLSFGWCTSLTSITCLATVPPTLDDSIYPVDPFSQTNNCPIYVPAASVTAYQTAWPQYASRIQALADYTLFNSIVDRSISGDYTIPSDVITIGTYAFAHCTSLTSITIPNTVETIGSGAFIGCSGLTSVVIGSGVMSILGTSGTGAFQNCTSLTSITCLATTPPTLDTYYAFYNTNDGPIYVPAASVETYKATRGWKTYSSRIQAIPS